MTTHTRMLSPRLSAVAVTVLAAIAWSNAQAFSFDTGDSSLKVRWDNTFKYSTIYRLHDPDAGQLAAYAGSPAGDGDRNFKQGLASSRMDWLSEFDVMKDNKYGARISATAWYDDIYQRNNKNTTGLSHNLGVASNEFNAETKASVGNGSRLMDAFVFDKGYVGNMPASVHVGRHTVIYGETLMSGANGIANAQGPVDIIKAATVPGAQVKEFLLPTNQISATLQPNDKVSLGAYYQFKWEKSPFFAGGSFLSPNDVVGPGGQTMLDNLPVTRTDDMSPRNGGQWGAQMRFRPDSVDAEFGLYAANYHDKTPSAVYVNVGSNPLIGGAIAPTTYTRVYQQDIRTYGASVSTVLGSDNVSMEVSIRKNQPLTGGLCAVGDTTHPEGCGYFVDTTTMLGGTAYNNTDNPLYAVGTTHHMTLVDIHVFQPNALLVDGGSMATQFDWHSVASVDKNPGMIDPTTTTSASSITFAFSADYFQVMDGLDLSVPIVYTHNVTGRSRVYVGWVDHGGSLDLGVNLKYRTLWKAGLNFHHFMGHHGVSIGHGAFDQTQWDRDYMAFNVSTTF
jgi:Protein of unknown function (DUF1302)